MICRTHIARLLLVIIATPATAQRLAATQRQNSTLTQLIRDVKPAVVTVGLFN